MGSKNSPRDNPAEYEYGTVIGADPPPPVISAMERLETILVLIKAICAARLTKVMHQRFIALADEVNRNPDAQLVLSSGDRALLKRMGNRLQKQGITRALLATLLAITIIVLFQNDARKDMTQTPRLAALSPLEPLSDPKVAEALDISTGPLAAIEPLETLGPLADGPQRLSRYHEKFIKDYGKSASTQ